ncbi:CHAT domain-containing protein [Leptolyngbya cf. ectocarpi LEGE 11479]|uniref:CHAT domain-containing protein n=1 Tax=Leptolyngbya cf. ectocarpi LEGE 11479 TaxID=1828722 RepID=A0A928ZY63_LEPEC|nr:CHAT domain-containing protein [Leptolyngbya ectocarpi]MBE9069626.1 CHAT domain-containing protein [Leptolyngbya cf. ectocarpi LEGE 11479]
MTLPALASSWLLASRAVWAANTLLSERRSITIDRPLLNAQTGSSFTKQSRDRNTSQLQTAYGELFLKVREGEAQAGDRNHRGAIATFNTAIELINDIEKTFAANFTASASVELTRLKAAVLIMLGEQHLVVTDYQAALSNTESGLALAQTINNLPVVAWAWVNLGSVQYFLGQYQQSIDACQFALSALRRTNINDYPSREISTLSSLEISALSCLGDTYQDQENYQEALLYFDAALRAAREAENLVQEASILISLGYAYVRLGDYDNAIEALETSAQIARTLDNGLVEAYAIGNLGYAYSFVGRYDEAIALLAEALPAIQDVGHRRGEWLIFSATGEVLARMGEPELAIIFYKQAVEVNEAIRADLAGLPDDVQQSYLGAASGLASIEASYRTLADLLLQANRVLEAQAVLDLLKVQELDDSLSDVQRGNHSPNISHWDIEEDVLRLYRQVLLEGQELARLQDPANQPLSGAETARRNELQARQQNLRTTFADWLNYPDVAALLTKLQTTSKRQTIDLQTQYAQLQRELRELPQTSVIIYPLILEERLELVLITPDAPPVRYPVAVTADQLRATVTAYGQILANPYQPAEPLAQQLYNWLIAPLATDLERVGAETIVYAPDGILRYIPLAALHDGQQWLAQRYSITHITAASLTNFSDRPQSQHRVLAAACAECEFTVAVAGRSDPFRFANLPATETEVSILAEQIPDTDILLNNDFSPTNVQNELGSYTILHLATHAAFVPEQPTESFIVFGNGEHVSLETIRRSWFLANADLVVLSACETAVGNVELGTGIEILGMGYQIQTAGAKSALASLWQVSDGGTQVLMNAFYAALNQGMTKAAALSTAQTAMLSDSDTVAEGERARLAVLGKDGQRVTVPQDMSHPYYWASFILIGNGL